MEPRIRFVSFNFDRHDGYGRFATRLLRAMLCNGWPVQPFTIAQAYSEDDLWGFHNYQADLTITCAPPYMVPKNIRGPHWVYTMTEGTELPDNWGQHLQDSQISHLIVPSEYNRSTFEQGSGIITSVVWGGTDPQEFCPRAKTRVLSSRYRFVALADRGTRKGWQEVWKAFYKLNLPDSELIIKCRPGGNDLIDAIAAAEDQPNNLRIVLEDVAHPTDIFAMGECIVLPSRSEGWGMPHREAAMFNVPVITLKYSGLDDGYTNQWSHPVTRYKTTKIGTQHPHIKGEWAIADHDQLAQLMEAAYHGKLPPLRARRWLQENQTWQHSVNQLKEVIDRWL